MPVSLICPLGETAEATFELSLDDASAWSSFDKEALGNRELMTSQYKCPLPFYAQRGKLRGAGKEMQAEERGK